MLTRRRRYLVAVLISTAAIAALIAVDDPFSAGAQPASSSQPAPAPQTAPVSAAAPVSSRFALLRKATGTRLPVAVANAVSHAPPSYALDPAQARETADGTWLIPGSAGTCLAIHDDEGVGMSCAANTQVEEGHLAFTVRDPASGEERIVGVVPDGAGSVEARNAEGESLARTGVQENTYELLGVHEAAQLEIE